jgi:hypothetical protein
MKNVAGLGLVLIFRASAHAVRIEGEAQASGPAKHGLAKLNAVLERKQLTSARHRFAAPHPTRPEASPRQPCGRNRLGIE